jgi:hypothetical protein
MKNKILVIGTIMMTFVLVSNAYAVTQNGAGQRSGGGSGVHEPGTGIASPELKEEGQGTGQGLQDGTSNGSAKTSNTGAGTQTQQQTQQKLQDGTETGNQVQNQNQVKNRGETNQIQTNEQSGTQNGNESGSAVAEQRKSKVANAVQEMLQVAEKNGGIGQQVKIIAQTQTQNQEKLETSLQKVQSRSGFAKFFVGPDYGEVNNAKKILEQNKEQIKQLSQVKNQLTNQGDAQNLTQQIQTLEQANLEIENSLGTAQKGFSLFGWMVRMFSN